MAIDNIPAGQSVTIVHMNVGGPGMVIQGSTVTLYESGIRGGDGGVGVGFSPDGTASNIVGGSVVTFPTPMGKLQVDGNSPVREGEPIVFLGQKTAGGTQVFLLTSFAPGLLPLPGREGVLTVGLPLATDLLFIGTSPAVTLLNSFSLGAAPNLPPGFDEVNLFLQSVEITAAGTVTLGAAEHLTILDRSL